MQGQVSFLSRPVILVMTVVILIVLLQTIWTQPAREKQQEMDIDVLTKATKILDILVSSEDCLALRTDVTNSAYAYIISREKLDEFAARYPDTEPSCARDYQYGYRVTVEDLTPRASYSAPGESTARRGLGWYVGESKVSILETSFGISTVEQLRQHILAASRIQIDQEVKYAASSLITRDRIIDDEEIAVLVDSWIDSVIPPNQGGIDHPLSDDEINILASYWACSIPVDESLSDFENYCFGGEEVVAGGGEKWEFGAAEFSKSSSLRAHDTRSIPVGIMMGEKDVRVGRITIDIYDGTLERISGFIDECCMLGELGTATRTRAFHADVLVSFRTDKVCLDYGAGVVCKPLLCGVEGPELPAGDYILTSKYSDGKVKITA